jgi:hypothetical protein
MAISVMMVGKFGGFIELFLKAMVGAIVYGLSAVILDFANFRSLAISFISKVRGKINV